MSRATPEEERLVARAAAGDDDAFADLTRALLPRLRRWALARTGDPHEADEVVQDTLIRMHRGLPGFAGAARVSTWVYRILTNVARERHRSRGRALVPASLSAVGEEATDAPDPEGRLHTRRLAAVVLDYFRTLPPGQREVLELVDHQGMRPVEVAAALDMNPVTVRAHLFKARRAIRRRVLERHPELMEGYEQ